MMQAYLSGHSVRKLQIGAGSVNYPGWLNTDIEPSGEQVYLDPTKPFSLPDGSIQYIFGEQPTAHPESEVLNLELRSFGHQFVYDPATLSDSLAQAGFERIAQFAPVESDDSQLQGVESGHKDPGIRGLNDYETMVLQAMRP
jgi:hypothetical protein